MEQTTTGTLNRYLGRFRGSRAKRTIATLAIAALTVSFAGIPASPQPASAAAGYFYQGAPRVECKPFRHSPRTVVPAGTPIGDIEQIKYMIESGQIAFEFFWGGKAHPTVRFINIYNASTCHIGTVMFAQFYKVFYPEGHPLRYAGQELAHEEGPYGIPAGFGLQFAYDGPHCALQLDLAVGAANRHIAGMVEGGPLCVKPTPAPAPAPTPTPPPAPTQCADGQDNDGDGASDMNDFSCSGPTDNDEANPKAACQDGSDNDGDGLTDFPQDPGCSSRQDNDEFNQASSSSSSSSSISYQCSDGVDNDNDGAMDQGDFSCSGPTDNDETNPKAACQDGSDNDNDGKIDFPLDPGCSSKQDNDEYNFISSSSSSSLSSMSSSSSSTSITQCNDGLDNDGDGASDMNDFSCSGPTDNDETNPKAACQDGYDNDGDGQTDFPNDPGCSSRQDNDEWNAYSSSSYSSSSSSVSYQCSDGIDNDGDGASDMNDFSCSNPTDTDETNPKAACQDGYDNDGDGQTDFPNDSGCSSRQDNDEWNAYSSSSSSSTYSAPQCADGRDNDYDQRIDAEDADCHTDGNPHNPNSYHPWRTENGYNSSSSSAQYGKVLRVTKDSNSREAFPGDIVEFRIRVTNTGSAPIHNVMVNDEFESSNCSVHDNGGGQENARGLEWNLGTLNAGESRDIRYRLKIRQSMQSGRMVRNDVRVRGNMQGGSIQEDNANISIAVLGTLPQTGNRWSGGGSQHLTPYEIKQNTPWWGGWMQMVMGWW